MIPRKKLDIGWGDLLAGVARSLTPGSVGLRQARLERFWDPDGRAVATLSVRTGLDLLLTVLRFPTGSEIVVSAVTIRDMISILRTHGLVPVPVDLDMDRLCVSAAAVEALITPRTRAVMVAHLFGSRMPMDDLIGVAERHAILLLEDCAQAYEGNGYRGHPQSDVSFFSLGPIKTNTALGGGLLRVRDPELAARLRTAGRALPPQTRLAFLSRVLKYFAIKTLLLRPVYTAFAWCCRSLGMSHDAVVSGAVRGFAGSDLITGIRRRPSYPLLALMDRRLRRFRCRTIRRREETAQRALALLSFLPAPGRLSSHHTHWVVPVVTEKPDEVAARLQRLGFDATRGASSLYAADAPAHGAFPDPTNAQQVMERLLFLPIYPGVEEREVRRMAEALRGEPLPRPSQELRLAARSRAS